MPYGPGSRTFEEAVTQNMAQLFLWPNRVQHVLTAARASANHSSDHRVVSVDGAILDPRLAADASILGIPHDRIFHVVDAETLEEHPEQVWLSSQRIASESDILDASSESKGGSDDDLENTEDEPPEMQQVPSRDVEQPQRPRENKQKSFFQDEDTSPGILDPFRPANGAHTSRKAPSREALDASSEVKKYMKQLPDSLKNPTTKEELQKTLAYLRHVLKQKGLRSEGKLRMVGEDEFLKKKYEIKRQPGNGAHKAGMPLDPSIKRFQPRQWSAGLPPSPDILPYNPHKEIDMKWEITPLKASKGDIVYYTFSVNTRVPIFGFKLMMSISQTATKRPLNEVKITLPGIKKGTSHIYKGRLRMDTKKLYPGSYAVLAHVSLLLPGDKPAILLASYGPTNVFIK